MEARQRRKAGCRDQPSSGASSTTPMIAVLAQRGQTPNSHTQDCRPQLVSPRALARRRQRAWPRLELRAALAHVEATVPRDGALWAGKAGATRPRLLDAVVGLAHERQPLAVEGTLERRRPPVGLQSARPLDPP